jgi:hypothetical protein
MARTSRHRTENTFNFRLDAELKSEFIAAADADHQTAAEVLRRFMRTYVEQKRRSAFEAEVRRQSLAIAARASHPKSDEHVMMRELDTELDRDSFSAEWTA